jgi:serine protease
VAIPATVPGAPTGVAATRGNATATVSWTPPADDGGSAVTSYVVTPFVGGVAQTPVTGVTGGSTTLNGLTNGTAYTFTVHAVNSVGAGSESAPSAAVTPQVPTAVTITSAPVTATYTVAIKVVGKLTRTDTGAAVAGQAVQLQVRKKGSTGAYATVATATSGSTGLVTFTTYKPTYATQIRLVRPLVAANAYGSSTSATKYVLCQMKISAVLSKTSVVHGTSVRLSGVVAPNHRGKTIYLQRKSGTRWVAVTSKVLSSTSGYAFTIKPTTRGTFYYRVMMKADTTFVVSYGVARALRAT